MFWNFQDNFELFKESVQKFKMSYEPFANNYGYLDDLTLDYKYKNT